MQLLQTIQRERLPGITQRSELRLRRTKQSYAIHAATLIGAGPACLALYAAPRRDLRQQPALLLKRTEHLASIWTTVLASQAPSVVRTSCAHFRAATDVA